MASDATVLVVDDETDVSTTYRNMLSDQYTVEVANSGEEALETLDDQIDVVLLDRRMPGISGDEVLERIREQAFSVRVVMVTAIDPDLSIVDMDFDEYLVKPVTGEQLQETIEKMLTRTSLDEQIQQMVKIASKLATLESKLEYSQLEASEEYESLLSEFETLRDDVTLPDNPKDPYQEAMIEKLETLLHKRPE